MVQQIVWQYLLYTKTYTYDWPNKQPQCRLFQFHCFVFSHLFSRKRNSTKSSSIISVSCFYGIFYVLDLRLTSFLYFIIFNIRFPTVINIDFRWGSFYVRSRIFQIQHMYEMIAGGIFQSNWNYIGGVPDMILDVE